MVTADLGAQHRDFFNRLLERHKKMPGGLTFLPPLKSIGTTPKTHPGCIFAGC